MKPGPARSALRFALGLVVALLAVDYLWTVWRNAALGSTGVMRERLAEEAADVLETLRTTGRGPRWVGNAARAEWLRSRLAASKTPRRDRLVLAIEELRAGQVEDAVERLDTLHQELSTDAQADPLLARHTLEFLALAQLRLGEVENCRGGHNADSCLFPISGGGVHRIRRGSERAIPLLEQVRAQGSDSSGVARWLLNLAHMTLGSHPGGLQPGVALDCSPALAEQDFPRFVDRAPALGVGVMTGAGGAVIDDLNDDGLLDLATTGWGLEEGIHLFASLGDGTFAEATEAAGLAGLMGGLNLVQADYDGDGDLDLLVLRGAWLGGAGKLPPSLLQNDGQGGFRDVTVEAGLDSPGPRQVAAWADYDNDGQLDLFLGLEGHRKKATPHSQLFRNVGDGTFVDVSEAAGLAVPGFVKGASWGDVDGDGWLDLYVSRFGQPNLLYRNLAGQRFEAVPEAGGAAEPDKSFACWFWDYDQDGDLDLAVVGYAFDLPRNLDRSLEKRLPGSLAFGPVLTKTVGTLSGEVPPGEVLGTRLYRNAGDGSFADVSSATRFDRVHMVMGANFGDVDNDGFPDAYFGTGQPGMASLLPNRMLRNVGGERFVDVTTPGGFGHLQKGHGVAFGDLDNDGDLDCYASMGGAFEGDRFPNVCFENPGNQNHWITLRLRGVRSNRFGLHARIQVRVQTPAGPRDVYSWVNSGGSFGASSLQAEIGLGAASAIESVSVRWPAGGEETHTAVELDRVYLLEEGGRLERVELSRLELAREAAGAGHAHHGH